MLKRTPLVDLNYKVTDIFPISIHQFKINDFDDVKDKLIDYAYNFKKQNLVGVNHSNIGGWQSPAIPQDSNLHKDDLLKNFLVDCLSDLPFIDRSYTFNFDAWININENGNFNMPHTHPKCHLSGVLWVKIPENSGNIIFISPYEHVAHVEIDELYSDEFKKSHNSFSNYFLNPTEGYMILFPSHLVHYVDVNKSNEDRISVAFNILFEDEDK